MSSKKTTKKVAKKSSTLSKADLIAELARRGACDKKVAEKLLNDLHDITLEYLAKGESVKIADMVTLEPKDKAAVRAERKMVAGQMRDVKSKPAHKSATGKLVPGFKKELLTKTAK